MIFICTSERKNTSGKSGLAVTVHLSKSSEIAIREAIIEFGKLYPNLPTPMVSCFPIPTEMVLLELAELSQTEGFEEFLEEWLTMQANSQPPSIERYVTNPTPSEDTESYRDWMNLGL